MRLPRGVRFRTPLSASGLRPVSGLYRQTGQTGHSQTSGNVLTGHNRTNRTSDPNEGESRSHTLAREIRVGPAHGISLLMSEVSKAARFDRSDSFAALKMLAQQMNGKHKVMMGKAFHALTRVGVLAMSTRAVLNLASGAVMQRHVIPSIGGGYDR